MIRSAIPWLVCIVLSLAFPNVGSAQVIDAQFTLVPRPDSGLDFVQRSGTAEQKYIIEVKSTGVALLDVDRDGLLDVFLTAGSTLEKYREGAPGYGCRLFRNKGNLTFEDVTAKCGLGSAKFGWASGAAVADVDGDGWDDLFVTAFGPDRLFLNRAGVFEETTSRSSLDRDGWSTSAAFADLDGDGDLDLYVARYLEFDVNNPPEHGTAFSCLWKEYVVMCGPRGMKAHSDRVYMNRGDGSFEDATTAWKLSGVEPQYGLGVVIADFVGDSRPDVFVANDSSPNHLLENKGDHFQEVGFIAGIGYSEDGQDQAGMGVAVADFDGNGYPDIVVTNFADERNNVYLNQGDGTFFDEADLLGVGPAGQSALSWGVACEDFDLDGRTDIYVANGHVYPQADKVKNTLGYSQRDHLFLEQGGRYREVGKSHGLNLERVSRGAAFGDLDNDGDIDVIVSHLNDLPMVYENRAATGRRALSIRLVQPGKNVGALGSRVDLTYVDATTERRQTRWLLRHGSFQASNDPRCHFGLGAYNGPARVLVTWPDRSKESFPIGGTAREVTLTRGSGKPQLPKTPDGGR